MAEKIWNRLKNRVNRKNKKVGRTGRFNWDKKDFLEWYESQSKTCHYCEIKENNFVGIWGTFYGGNRGKTLEVDRQNNTKSYGKDNCVLACALCNCAKSDKISYDDFKKELGPVIKKIWQKEASAKGISF